MRRDDGLMEFAARVLRLHSREQGSAVDSALETALIPSSNNAELKSLLQTGLKIFPSHEQHAEHVAAALK